MCGVKMHAEKKDVKVSPWHTVPDWNIYTDAPNNLARWCADLWSARLILFMDTMDRPAVRMIPWYSRKLHCTLEITCLQAVNSV